MNNIHGIGGNPPNGGPAPPKGVRGAPKRREPLSQSLKVGGWECNKAIISEARADEIRKNGYKVDPSPVIVGSFPTQDKIPLFQQMKGHDVSSDQIPQQKEFVISPRHGGILTLGSPTGNRGASGSAYVHPEYPSELQKKIEFEFDDPKLGIKIEDAKNDVIFHKLLSKNIITSAYVTEYFETAKIGNQGLLIVSERGFPAVKKLFTAENSSLNAKDKLFYLKQLLTAIHAFERAGVAHNDVKPDNIVFDQDGNFKMIDFGKTMRLDQSSSHGGGGTPPYMAAEIIKGTLLSPVQADIYSCGVMAYQLTHGGQFPLHTKEGGIEPIGLIDQENKCNLVEILDARASANQLNIPDDTPSLDRLILRMLHPDPEQRPTPEQALAEFEQLFQVEPSSSLDLGAIKQKKSILKGGNAQGVLTLPSDDPSQGSALKHVRAGRQYAVHKEKIQDGIQLGNILRKDQSYLKKLSFRLDQVSHEKVEALYTEIIKIDPEAKIYAQMGTKDGIKKAKILFNPVYREEILNLVQGDQLYLE